MSSLSLHDEQQQQHELIEQRYPNNSVVYAYPADQKRPVTQMCGHCSKPYPIPLYIKNVPDSSRFLIMCYGCIVPAGREVKDYTIADEELQAMTMDRVRLECCNTQCMVKFRRKDIIAHLNEQCLFENKPVECKHVGCHQMILKNQMPVHEAVCDYKLETCTNQECTHQCAHKDMPLHHSSCPLELIQCKRAQCRNPQYKRQDLKQHMDHCREKQPCKTCLMPIHRHRKAEHTCESVIIKCALCFQTFGESFKNEHFSLYCSILTPMYRMFIERLPGSEALCALFEFAYSKISQSLPSAPAAEQVQEIKEQQPPQQVPESIVSPSAIIITNRVWQPDTANITSEIISSTTTPLPIKGKRKVVVLPGNAGEEEASMMMKKKKVKAVVSASESGSSSISTTLKSLDHIYDFTSPSSSSSGTSLNHAVKQVQKSTTNNNAATPKPLVNLSMESIQSRNKIAATAAAASASVTSPPAVIVCSSAPSPFDLSTAVVMPSLEKSQRRFQYQNPYKTLPLCAPRPSNFNVISPSRNNINTTTIVNPLRSFIEQNSTITNPLSVTFL